jgi:hypothetical protein
MRIERFHEGHAIAAVLLADRFIDAPIDEGIGNGTARFFEILNDEFARDQLIQDLQPGFLYALEKLLSLQILAQHLFVFPRVIVHFQFGDDLVIDHRVNAVGEVRVRLVLRPERRRHEQHNARPNNKLDDDA